NWCRGEEELKKTPFIMVTSRGDKNNVVQAVQAGVSDYIGKPFTSEQLLTKVKKALQSTGRLDDLQAQGTPTFTSTLVNDSLSALTANRPAAAVASSEPVTETAAAAPTPPAPVPAVAPTAKPSTAPAPAAKPASTRSRGQLRLSAGTLPCLIKALSLRHAPLQITRGGLIPQLLESAVLDLQHDDSDVARLNGYVHAIAAAEPKPNSEWLQLIVR